jgi:exonuclease SbcD
VLSVALASARRALRPGVPSIVLSHAFVTGAEQSDSEHQIAVGDAGMVPASLYDDFDYVALGHLHRPQEVGGRAHVRYSGSPLRYSFSETVAKQVVVVELGPDGVERMEALPVGVGRGVAVRTGTMDDLLAGSDEENWVRAEVTDPVRPVDAIRRLRERYPHIVEMEWTGRADSAMSPGACRARNAGPEEMAEAFWEDATGEPPDAAVAAVLAGSLQSAPADRRESEVAA